MDKLAQSQLDRIAGQQLEADYRSFISSYVVGPSGNYV